ncbi:MAG: hypothetical protein ACK40M_10655 [Flavobacteriales bacterium]
MSVAKRIFFHFLEWFFVISTLALITISVLGFILIQIDCFSLPINWGINGLQFYLKQFEPISTSLGASLALIGGYFLLEQVRLMLYSNMINEFNQWDADFKRVIENIRTENPAMANYFTDISKRIYKYLYVREFLIFKRLSLRKFYWKFIKFRVEDFEKNSKGFLDENNKIYSNGQNPYSIKQLKTICDYIFKASPNREVLVEKMGTLFNTRFNKKFKEIEKAKEYPSQPKTPSTD